VRTAVGTTLVIVFTMAMKVFAVAMLAASAGAMELTKDSWDAAVAGKSVFIKFQAPW